MNSQVVKRPRGRPRKSDRNNSQLIHPLHNPVEGQPSAAKAGTGQANASLPPLTSGLDGSEASARLDEWQAALEADGLNVNPYLTVVDTDDDAPVGDDTTHKASRGRPPKTVGAFNKREADMVTEMTKLYGTVGTMLFLISPQDGMLIASGAADRAKEVVMIARHHPQMWNVLVTLTTASDYTPFFVGHGMLLVAILQNHNVLPADLTQLMRRPPAAATPSSPQQQQQQAHYPPHPQDEMTAAAMAASAAFPPADPIISTTPPDGEDATIAAEHANHAAFNVDRR